MAEEKKYVYVRAPIFDSQGKVDEREQRFRDWWRQNRKNIRRRFNNYIFDYNTLAPRNILLMSEEVYVIYPASKTALVPKGLIVRLELLALLDQVDSKSIDRDQCYFILIDGSGAIDFNGIELVLDKFINKKAPVVLGKRPADREDWFMGHPDRKRVELFEKYLLEQKFSEQIKYQFRGELPDAQAGCWGFCLGVQKYLSLTARDYSIEFDLIASALEDKLPIDFTDTLKPGDRIGGSGQTVNKNDVINFVPSIRKMEFILHKLNYSKSDIDILLTTYKRKFGNDKEREIPEKYETLLREFINS